MAARARLTARQRRFLLDQGYLVVRSLLDQAVLARITVRLQERVRQTVAAWAQEPGLDTSEGCVMASFDVADPDFAPCHQHPLLADAATVVLGDPWYVRELDLRAPIPGCGEQGLHTDYDEPVPGLPSWRTLSAMWCVTPFTRDSGPLRVIPGSHRRSEPPIDTEHGYATGMGPHPDEVKITAPPGSVILFNASDLWHSGTFNYTPAARLALTVHFDPGTQPTAGPGRAELPGDQPSSAPSPSASRPGPAYQRRRTPGTAGWTPRRRDRACRCPVVGCTG